MPRSCAGGRELENRARRSQHSLGVSPEHAVLPPGHMPRDMNDGHVRPLARGFYAPMRVFRMSRLEAGEALRSIEIRPIANSVRRFLVHVHLHFP